MKLLASFLFLCLVAVKPVFAQTETYHCEFPTQQGPRGLTIYSSDVFQANHSQEDLAIQAAWNNYIHATYSVKAGDAGVCQGSTVFGRDADASIWEKKKAEVRDVKVIHVKWAYASQHLPPAAAAAPTPQEPPCNPQAQHRATNCPQGPTTSYVVCTAADPSPTAYVSATFQVTGVDNAGWTNGFAQFLAVKYGYKGGGVGCNQIHEDTSRTFLKNRVIGLRANRKTVVETGWTYNSSPAVAVEPIPAAPVAAPVPSLPARAAAPAPPAAARGATAPSSPQNRYGICWATALTTPNTIFFSATFESVPPTAVWSNAYRQVLRDQYQLRSINIHCSAHASLDEAQQVKGRVSGNMKVVDTGWKNQ